MRGDVIGWRGVTGGRLRGIRLPPENASAVPTGSDGPGTKVAPVVHGSGTGVPGSHRLHCDAVSRSMTGERIEAVCDVTPTGLFGGNCWHIGLEIVDLYYVVARHCGVSVLPRGSVCAV